MCASTTKYCVYNSKMDIYFLLLSKMKGQMNFDAKKTNLWDIKRKESTKTAGKKRIVNEY